MHVEVIPKFTCRFLGKLSRRKIGSIAKCGIKETGQDKALKNFPKKSWYVRKQKRYRIKSVIKAEPRTFTFFKPILRPALRAPAG